MERSEKNLKLQELAGWEVTHQQHNYRAWGYHPQLHPKHLGSCAMEIPSILDSRGLLINLMYKLDPQDRLEVMYLIGGRVCKNKDETPKTLPWEDGYVLVDYTIMNDLWAFLSCSNDDIADSIMEAMCLVEEAAPIPFTIMEG